MHYALIVQGTPDGLKVEDNIASIAAPAKKEKVKLSEEEIAKRKAAGADKTAARKAAKEKIAEDVNSIGDTPAELPLVAAAG